VIRRIREHGLALVFAAVGVWTMVYLGLYGFAWTDYDFEVTPAYDALRGGHLWRFFQLAPGYGGSLELRAPFAMLPALWHGGELAVYQAGALPCLIAAALLGVWLCGRMRAAGAGRLARGSVLMLCAANPITVWACEIGHPEDLLGAVLCITAVLAAQRRRVAWAGVLLGLAIVNKEWALLAVGPVLLALDFGRRRALLIAGGIAAACYAPLVAAALTRNSGLLSVGDTGSEFQPWQLWWFLGSHGHIVRSAAGVIKAGYRTPPGWIANVTHPLIVALGVPLSGLVWWRARRATRIAGALVRVDALGLLALLLLMRCMLDPWDDVYYPLPFLIALLSWEALRWRRPPVYALAATFAAWGLFVELPLYVSADLQALAFALVSVPAAVLLGRAVFAARRPAGAAAAAADEVAGRGRGMARPTRRLGVEVGGAR
jgi:hypothetical protein